MSKRIKFFKIKDLFNIYKGTRLTKDDMIGGSINYLGAIDNNNGVRQKIDVVPKFSGNCITVNYNGSVGEAFYQSEPFWASDDVNILELKDYELNKKIGMYLTTLIRANKNKFSYGRKWTMDKMREEEIPLPVCDNEKPDWDYIESYISKLGFKPITTQIDGKNVQQLNIQDWGEFRVGDLFKFKQARGNVTDDLVDGQDIPYIAAKYDDNGLAKMCSIENAENWISVGNSIVFIQIGAGSAGYTTYQPKQFIGMSGKIICGYNKNLNKYNALFLTTVLNKNRPKYNFGRSWTGDRLRNTIVELPSLDGQPDWQFMEDYIKSLPYSDRI